MTDTATLLFDGGNIFSNTDEDIYAVHVLDNGNIVLSTKDDATIGALSFGDDDLVEYNPSSGTATMYFDGGNNFSATDEDIVAVYIAEPTDGGYWKLDETSGTTAADSSVNSRDGTLSGGLSFGADSIATCELGNVLQFDGIDDEVDITGYKGISGSTARSVSAWIKTTSGTTGAIISWGTDAAGQLWVLRVQEDDGKSGTLRIDVGSGYVVGTSDLRDDAWHHVMAVLPQGSTDVTDVLLYVNGALETFSDSQSQTINTASGDDAKIGSDQ